MSNELSFELGAVSIYVELHRFGGWPSLWVSLDINWGEYREVLATLDRISAGGRRLSDDRHHHFYADQDGLHEFLNWAGTLSYAVNATQSEIDGFRNGLVSLIVSVGTWTKVTSYDH